MSWTAWVVRVPAVLEDDVVALLGEGALGIETRPQGDSVELRITRPAHDRGIAQARQTLSRLGPFDIREETIDDGFWVERYQAGLRPFEIGTRFLVLPGEQGTDRADREVLRLVPGRAFGTGEHPTTRLCVEALERAVRRGSRWLDVGTGSGILALVAARLGAREVVARDDDPDAIAVAYEVLEANGADPRIQLEVGSLDGLTGAFDGIAANVARPFFMEHAAALGPLLAPGGVVLATGLLEEDEADVTAVLTAAGLTVRERSGQPPWILLRAERRR